eukprot:CAMPEP_0118654608 /NCGR_PEP_ID=MMETSP0785-20121206/12484_1 /TAXON_ID=91992 /ORGANISM="Bolidomonas pacifica, Strain CCMP 1866" /LENGTH=129 /DNA_ID=CAMNT_0006547287 /DNA_START=152 /DNA_END=538 /DNA_ORIENTATION=+
MTRIFSSSSFSDDKFEPSPSPTSVTKKHWEDGRLHIRMFTKGGCTLCDVVKREFESYREKSAGSSGFTFSSVDITDVGNEGIYEKYKYDIPVVTGNGEYWFKHRIPKELDWESEISSLVSKGGEGHFEK